MLRANRMAKRRTASGDGPDLDDSIVLLRLKRLRSGLDDEERAIIAVAPHSMSIWRP